MKFSLSLLCWPIFRPSARTHETGNHPTNADNLQLQPIGPGQVNGSDVNARGPNGEPGASTYARLASRMKQQPKHRKQDSRTSDVSGEGIQTAESGDTKPKQSGQDWIVQTISPLPQAHLITNSPELPNSQIASTTTPANTVNVLSADTPYKLDLYAPPVRGVPRNRRMTPEQGTNAFGGGNNRLRQSPSSSQAISAFPQLSRSRPARAEHISWLTHATPTVSSATAAEQSRPPVGQERDFDSPLETQLSASGADEKDREIFRHLIRIGQIVFSDGPDTNKMINGKLHLNQRDPAGAQAALKEWNASRTFAMTDLGKVVGESTFKKVYKLKDHPSLVIAVISNLMKERMQIGNTHAFDVEIMSLNYLAEFGFPTVRTYGPVQCNALDGMLMDYISGGVCTPRLSDSQIKQLNLRQNTIDDLERIKRLLSERDVIIEDLQFMVAEDGAVRIIDPLSLDPENKEKVRQENLQFIDRVLGIARQKIGLRHDAPTDDGH